MVLPYVPRRLVAVVGVLLATATNVDATCGPLFAITSGTVCMESLPYSPTPNGALAATASPQVDTSLGSTSHDSWRQILTTSDSKTLTIEWEFLTTSGGSTASTKTISDRFVDAISTGEFVKWTVTYDGTPATTATVIYGTWRWTTSTSNSAGRAGGVQNYATAWASGTGTVFSSDDGAWGAAGVTASVVDGETSNFGAINSGGIGFWGTAVRSNTDSCGTTNPGTATAPCCNTLFLGSGVATATVSKNLMYVCSVTSSPTTASPTTASPTTTSPTTASPTTASPTTASPTTASPTTTSPTASPTGSPTTSSPTSGCLDPPFVSTSFENQPTVLKALGADPTNVPMTRASYAKIWTACTTVGTATISYVLDDLVLGADSTKTVTQSTTLGTSLASDEQVYVLLNGLEEGEHTLTFTCVDNSCGTSSTRTYTWLVDFEDELELEWTDTPSSGAAATRHASKSFSVKASKAVTPQIASVAWMCSVRLTGKSASFASCGCGDSQTCTFSAEMTDGDGRYEVQVYVVYTYTLYGSARRRLSTYHPSDLGDGSGTITSRTLRFTKELDTHPPTLKVTSSPPARQSYTAGMTVKFAFECEDDNPPCTFQCALDGKNSTKAGASSAGRGYFSCSSPVHLTPQPTTTHAFSFRAIDSVGNVSPMSSLYTFYTDGTAPVVEFRHTATSSDTAATICEKGDDRCRTVLQVDSYDPQSDSWDVKEGYEGVVAASRVVNGAKTNYVLDSTSATTGKIGYKCLHPEFEDTSDLPV